MTAGCAVCGFAGEYVFSGGGADAAAASAMAEVLGHRGPDEAGRYVSPDGRLAVAVRRLAVIDPPGSQQPMSSADGRCAVAFNGEIYNYRELRRALACEGAVFRTAGDTEVLLHLYRRDGADMLARLRGMFALALYERDAGLLLARDRLGQKPLWYALLPGRLLFASEAKALLAHPAVDKSVDYDSIVLYMSMGYIAAPRTVWAGVRKLPPGCFLRVGAEPCEPRRYWAPPAVGAPGSPAEQHRRVRELLSQAVAARMVSDVPLGALLSGGVDSSIVVALMSQAAGAAGGVRTFCAGFADGEYDERPAARRVAEHCGTQHTELLVRPQPAEAVDDVVRMYDEPFADSSALPTYLICRAARGQVTVALCGDGGDEVFGGYDRYRAMHLADVMGPGRYMLTRAAGGLARLVAPHDERSGLRRLVRFADALPHPPSVQYFMYRRVFGPAELAHLFCEEFAEGVDLEAPARWFCELYERPDVDEEICRAQRHDLETYLPDDLLVKADIASMAASLELRAPMLDHDVVALGLGLPVEAKLAARSARGGKKILREAFGDLLPAETLGRRKQGFGVPLGRWLREDLAASLKETLLDGWFLGLGFFRPVAVRGLINDHLCGKADHRHRLWALLVLARWLSGAR
jgi:asparagine synthase (glutamine-hydrolysing)